MHSDKMGQNVWGLDRLQQHTDWLHISLLPDSQMPQIILRIRHATTQDAEETFVHIFATNLTRASYDAIKFETGEAVEFGELWPKEVQRERPWLVESVETCMVTAMHIKLCRVSRGESDGEDGRVSRPIISGRSTLKDLERMKTDPATPQEKLLGLIHAGKIRELTFYTEYDRGNQAVELAREQGFCEHFRTIMVLCNQLGHFWAYRRQFPAFSWKDAAFPFSQLSPPRWTITKWFPRAEEVGAEQTATPPRAAEWEPINRPQVFPGDEEEAFVRGLDEAGRGFVSED
jgi:hypothetical protein